MTPTRDSFCRKLIEQAPQRPRAQRIWPERMADEFVRYFGISLRPDMTELKKVLREAGFGDVRGSALLPAEIRGIHYSSPHGGYDIRYHADQSEGATVHTVLHETYEIILETLSGSLPSGDVCREANRFAASILLQPREFSLFARASGFDVLALQKEYQCSYAAVTLRLGEVMRDQPMMAILYERDEYGNPQEWSDDAGPQDFRAKVASRTTGFTTKSSPLLFGQQGGCPALGSSLPLGSLSHRVLETGKATYAEEQVGRDGRDSGHLAVAARPVLWFGRLAKIAVVAVPYDYRAVLEPQLSNYSFDRLVDWAVVPQ